MAYVLGLDLGAASLGWAAIQRGDNGFEKVLGVGVRIFEAGMEGDIEGGKEESRNAQRRAARQRRRQLARRVSRQVETVLLLQEAGLLPAGDLKSSISRHQILNDLDSAIYRNYLPTAKDDRERKALDQLPYYLRAKALDGKLPAFELGRAFYHLAQRRGFLSNRKAQKETDDETSKVKQEIQSLSETLERSGVRTLGEFLSKVDPVAERRLRKRWTARSMYEQEFERIWTAQQPHHAGILTEELKSKLHHALFYQRPLRSQKHLVGNCELEPDRKRAPWALLIAQRFRMLQRVNDLEIVFPNADKAELTPEQRQAVLAELEDGDVKFTVIRKKLKLPKGAEFNLERGGEDKLPGNRTAGKLRKIFGHRWDAFTPEQRDRIVDDVRSIRKEEVLERRGIKAWGLNAEEAKRFSEVKLEDKYCSLSRQAIQKLLPYMEQGMRFRTAVDEAYEKGNWAKQVLDALPPVLDTTIALRNPAVVRVLTEMRKVVNAIIRKYGKPEMIRIELARELRNSKDRRKEMSKQMRERQKKREAAAERAAKEVGIQNPKRSDIEKVLLAEECNWECPYTGKRIGMQNLLGPEPQFDVEHIIPFARCLDDSYLNKTLCYHEENRAKGNRTPWEAYHATPQWEEILARVSNFTGDAARKKLERFKMQNLDSFDTFAQRQLNDTRYASTQAAKYLSWLYGEDWRKHIQATSGGVTVYLRDAWRLNHVLNDGGMKSRDDHRHHAVDAIAIALAEPATIKMLSRAAEQNLVEKGRSRGWHKRVQEPWTGFFEETARAIEKIVVSHRVSRKVNGRLHEDTFYSPPKIDEDGKTYVHIRKPLEMMSMNDVQAIVDEAVRTAVLQRLHELGSNDPKKAFLDVANRPYLVTKSGRRVPIHRARIRRNLTPFPVGGMQRSRFVTADSNHHAEIVETVDKKGEPRWNDYIVDRYTALNRIRLRQPIVTRNWETGRFVSSIAPGDVVELTANENDRKLYVVRSISKDLYNYVRIEDARLKKDIIDAGDWGAVRLNGLRRMGCRKLSIDPLGEVYPAND